MTSLPACGSEAFSAIGRLHPEIRRWIEEQGWTALNAIQEQAVPAILDRKQDLIFSATTAAGKTEAALLPILTRYVDASNPGLLVYVSPLKALINDQYRRFEALGTRLDVPVVRWHGDAPPSAKHQLLRDPNGLVLITPESIEALFVRRPSDCYRLFENVRAIIIDELHTFLQGSRGLHLASLLSRVHALVSQRPRHIGLSATIGDFSAARTWLCPEAPHLVEVLNLPQSGQELLLKIHGFVEPADDDVPGATNVKDAPEALADIADDIFAKLRGSDNLVFAGSRRNVESLSDRLRVKSARSGVPLEFFPHHGNLAKELRENLESRLKKDDLPTTAIATTTLELGIDIGSVQSVAQIDAPRSIAGLRQRLGRSGRKPGTSANLRIYLREPYLGSNASPLDRLRLETVRSVAAIRLLQAGFVEPPGFSSAQLSVAAHQILSIITEKHGARADAIYRQLQRTAGFVDIPKEEFATLLRSMAAPDKELIEQINDGTIVLGQKGETLICSRGFFAVFPTSKEWRLIATGKTLGTIPLVNVVGVGNLISFAGQRWCIVAADRNRHVLEVVPHSAAHLPRFDRSSLEPVHDKLVKEMRVVYEETEIPAYLDRTAESLLIEGREAYAEMGLADHAFQAWNGNSELFLWHGTVVNSVIAAGLSTAGLECEAHDVGITVFDTNPMDLRDSLTVIEEGLTTSEMTSPEFNFEFTKYDWIVPEKLRRSMWAKQISSMRETVAESLKRIR